MWKRVVFQKSYNTTLRTIRKEVWGNSTLHVLIGINLSEYCNHFSNHLIGMPNASIPTPEPVKQRKMFGAYGKSVGAHSVAFVSKVYNQR